ncbi:hypothetical protein EDC23_1387 [Thiohalophilus thiocyanatoxydans]|uniref:Uncharacterized protein n=1 Tax=Thiohalophilus thiocyanatoxydans TaxID=381308 RepID=A0A4R8IZU9_9GAMM|nr:hypothetical protein EDC23_1387 [Thiohalophilus thiocyanatoxydans]
MECVFLKKLENSVVFCIASMEIILIVLRKNLKDMQILYNNALVRLETTLHVICSAQF